MRTQKVGEKGFSVASRNLNNLPPLSESSFPSQIHRSLIFIPPSHLSWQEGTKGKNTVINLFHHGNLVENHLVVLHKHSSPSLHCRPETYALAVYYTDKRALRAQAVWSRVRALSRSLVLTSVRFDFSSDWTSLWFFHL